jgi:hypothetical protein
MSGRQTKRIRRETKRALAIHLANRPAPVKPSFWQRVKFALTGRM